MNTEADSIQFEMRSEDEMTVIEIETDEALSVIVESEAGEEIYLPTAPSKEPDGPPSSYRPSRKKKRNASGDGPPSSYQPAGGPSADEADLAVGRRETANGFQVVHPEPVTDIRVLTA